MARSIDDFTGIHNRSSVFYVDIGDVASVIVSSASVNSLVPIVSASVSVVVNSGSTTNVTVAPQTHFYAVDATTANTAVTLPSASLVTGRSYTIKKLDVSANFVHISGTVPDKIWHSGVNPVPFINLRTQGQAYTLISDGSTWHVIGFYSGTAAL